MARAINHIFHALNLILQHIGVAIQITAGWMLICALAGAAIFASSDRIAIAPNPENRAAFEAYMQENAGIMLLFILVVSIAFSCCAVAWHRYILLDEKPKGLLVLPSISFTAEYILRTILIALITAIPLITITGIAGLLIKVNQSPVLVIALSFIVSLITQYIFTRFCLALPATAIGEGRKFSILAGWKASSNDGGLIFWVCFLTVCIVTIFELLTGVFVTAGAEGASVTTPTWVIAVKLIFYWLYFMFGIGILSTLYGSLVERREI